MKPFRTIRLVSVVLPSLLAAACAAPVEQDGSGFDAEPGEGLGEATEASPDVAARPIDAAEIARRRDILRQHADSLRTGLQVRATTISPSGAIIDWVEPGSQTLDGVIASPPPPIEGTPKTGLAVTELTLPDAERGPEGTVPVGRLEVDRLPDEALPTTVEQFMPKFGADMHLYDRAAQIPMSGATSNYFHQYAEAYQWVTNYGTDGVLHVGTPYIYRNGEFSLGQLALVRGADSSRQTVEAGWQVWPQKYGDYKAHLFVYYTTCNYTQTANEKGGYNRDVLGWQQVSSKIRPGDALASLGELALRVRLYQGNWWIAVNGEWMGYYPATLFSTTGLRSQAAKVDWYGEVTDYKWDSTTTYTSMGTGFYGTGAGASYARNMRYENSAGQLFNLTASRKDTKPGCYSSTLNNNTGTWKTYMYFGGPGKTSPNCI